MKLFLTSQGLTNDILKNTFLDLIGHNVEGVHIAFITTASNVEKDTSYIEKDKKYLVQLGIKQITSIDISTPKDQYMESLQSSDVIWVEGGNTFYLLDEIRKSGLHKNLTNILQNKIYVGVSAGSIIATPTIAIASVEPSDPNDVEMIDFTGIGLVPFEVSPHTPDDVPLENVVMYSQTTRNPIYAYDNDCAVLVLDDKVSFVGNGFCKALNSSPYDS